MSDKIEYSRMLVKRTDQTGVVPTIPPITATTLNQMIPTDLFVGEFFLNEVDDLLWIRTAIGILPIALSGSTGTTSNQTLTQVLFEGNVTNGYDIVVSAGDTIVFSGLSSGSTSQFLGIDASGNTIVSTVTPGTPNLSSVLSVGNTTGANDISVNVSQKVKGQSGLNWIQPETGDGNLEINIDNELTILGITSGVTDIVLSYDPDTKYVRYQSISGGSGSAGTSGTSGTSGTNGSSGTSGINGTSGTDGSSGTNGTSGTSGVNGTNGTSGTNGSSGTSGVSGDILWTSGITEGSLLSYASSANTLTHKYSTIIGGQNTQIAEGYGPVNGFNIITNSTNSSIASSQYSALISTSGSSIQASYYSGIFAGYDNSISNNTNYNSVILGGESHLILIDNNNSSILGGDNHYIERSNNSSIIGGENNRIRKGSSLTTSNSVIIGGQSITATTDNMVYVPDLTIVSATTGTSIASLGIDSTGKVIKTNGGVGSYLPLSGGTVTGNTQIIGQSWVKLPTTGNTTSATTINWNDGNVQEKVLNVASTTFTFTNPNAGGTYILILKQSSSGSGTVTWPGTVSWAGGTPPTMTSTANKYDVYTFVFDGSKYFGSYVQDFT